LDVTSPASGQARRRGRPRKFSAADVDALVELARGNPLFSLEDTAAAFQKQGGVSVSPPTAHRYLLAAGFHFQRERRDLLPPAAGSGEEGAAEAEPLRKHYGYGEAHRDPGDLVRYPCGLTDSEWEQVKHLFDPPQRTGRPAKYPRRQLLDACIYLLRSGCSWRMLPKDFPAWPAVYKTFRRWLARDLFETLYDELRTLWRMRQQRAADPTAAVIDSQAVKTSPQGGPKGYDAGKKVKGRKRHLVTDTLGLLIAVLITTGSVQDRDAALPVMGLAMAKVPGIKRVYADGGYAGRCAQALQQRYQLAVEVVRHPHNRTVGRWQQEQLPLFTPVQGFVVLPKRWVIERTNAWTERPRRMNKDHDRNLSVSTAWIWLTEGRMLLRRLTAAPLAHT
jgi:transposase